MISTGAIREVAPQAGIGAVLNGADFVDSFQVRIPRSGLDAEAAARLMFQRQPRWVVGLMRLRDAIVGPLGLKTSDHAADDQPAIGIFPIVTATPSRIILGFPDKHLDFRVVVDIAATAAGDEVTSTTLVKLNNLAGRLYLAVILPFHRLVVRSTLKSLADHISDNLS